MAHRWGFARAAVAASRRRRRAAQRGSQGTVAREPAAYVSAIVIAVILLVLAYFVAPTACKGGLEMYVWSGAAALLLLPGLPFLAHLGRSVLVRIALGFGFFAFGVGAWLAGLFAANVRFICGLGYL